MTTAKIAAFIRGAVEFRSDCTWADPARGDGGPTALDDFYDAGREFAHRITRRAFER
jgi:hypothetical protein